MNTTINTHTPGPWAIDFDPYGYRITAKAPTANMARREICKVTRYIDPKSDEAANARLIAAAPELLEALKNIIEGGNADRGTYWQVDISDINQARAAIAKAEGSAE